MPNSTVRRHRALAILLASLLAMATTSVAGAATLTIVNQDGASEGFNDPTPASPVGGNTGTTLGEQRLTVFAAAADIWGQVLESDVEIRIEARFDPLSCSAFSAILGGAGARAVSRDFPGAQVAETWYPIALANALLGTDQAPGSNDISATFNSSIDDNDSCLFETNWYLGLDHQNGTDVDLLTVVLHEIGHGLGFASFVNESTGAEFLGFPDIFGFFSLDLDAGLHWDEMASDAQRQASAVNTGDLVWDGPSVTNQAAGFLSAGTNAGLVRLYAPDPVQPGSSVSHFDTAASPNLLMEPAINGDLGSDLDLSDELMQDIGWSLAGSGPICGNGIRESGEACDGLDFGGQGCSDFGCGDGDLSCNADCQAIDASSCGACGGPCNFNGVCEAGEDCSTCGADCISGTTSGAVCGNGICEAGNGENCVSCAADCAGKQNKKPSGRFCCGDGGGQNPADCSSQTCNGNGFTCTTVPADAGSFCCGFGGCETGESCGNCALDCTLGAELCSGGVDEDCNGQVDCGDSVCSTDPACSSDGLPAGSPCAQNSDCASNKCRGRSGSKTCK